MPNDDLSIERGAIALDQLIAGSSTKARGEPQTIQKNAPAEGRLSPQRIIALEIGELLERDFPPMEPLLAPWLCKQHLSMVYAWRGVGKTHFALGVA